jgi:hypothetical protein
MEAVLRPMHECEQACTHLTSVCLSTADFLRMATLPLREVARRVVDCSYVTGGLSRVLEHPETYDPITIERLAEAVGCVARSCAEACETYADVPTLIRCSRAARQCERACSVLVRRLQFQAVAQ